MNITISVDNMMGRLWYPLSPSFNVFQADRPYKVSGNVSLPKPDIAAIAGWLDDDTQDEVYDQRDSARA